MIRVDKLTRFEIRKLITERRLLLEEEEGDAEKASINTIKESENELIFRGWIQEMKRSGRTRGDVTFTAQQFNNSLKKLFKNLPSKTLDANIPKKGKDQLNKYVRLMWDAPMGKDNNAKTFGEIFLEDRTQVKAVIEKVKTGDKDIDWNNYLSSLKRLGAIGQFDNCLILTAGYNLFNCKDAEGKVIESQYNECKKIIFDTLGHGNAIDAKTNEKTKEPESEEASKEVFKDTKSLASTLSKKYQVDITSTGMESGIKVKTFPKLKLDTRKEELKFGNIGSGINIKK